MNDNCLAGLRCPECSSEGPFHISVTCLATVHDSGTEDFSCVEWDDSSVCICPSCEWRGVVRDLRRMLEDPPTPDGVDKRSA